MTRTIELDRIKSVLPTLDLMSLIETGFMAYSRGMSVVPPVGELRLDKGEVHIKYGFITSQPYYVIKIASGFYGNVELGLSTSGGCMLVFCQETGQLKGVLLDEGFLTDVRTAVAGAIAAKYLAPEEVDCIGIAGTGIQARAQLDHLRSVTRCRDVIVWGRSQEKLDQFVEQASEEYRVESTRDIGDLQSRCNLIVTTTPATSPLLSIEHLRRGVHITAVGSDVPEKQELESAILASADLVVADSIAQCQHRGEISHALRNQDVQPDNLLELGHLVSGQSAGRTSDDQITVADLTGVAVQDIQIATAVFDACNAGNIE